MNPIRLPIDPKRLRRLLNRLLDIYSPSGKEEEVVEYVYRYLKRRGLPVIRQEVDERRQNLVVPFRGREAELGLVGHLDTVTAYDLEDFGAREEGDRIVGLGASDMKGSCAAMIETVTCLWEQGFRDMPLLLALVVGEEEEGDGAEELVKEFSFPWAVIGEPTDLRPCLSHYGYLEVQLSTRGDRLHASLARQGRNAVQGMLRVLSGITAYLEGHRPEAVYNIRDLYTPGGGFVVPDACEAWLDVHLPPSAPVGDIRMEMEDLVTAEKGRDPTLDAVIRFPSIHGGYSLPEKGPLIAALKAVFQDRGLPWAPVPFPSHSDANQLWRAGVKPIILGCGLLEEAHRPGESVSFEKVREAAEIYCRLAADVLSGV
ncbi:MAG: M20/M25/M40 family metallo-hydrolase [Deltaproteobacteria bacterium]|nr:M20/M25/M40 family metallo-hydrolase [Deltaproteobacteria bacterium]